MLFAQVIVDGLLVGLIFALVAMGLSLVYGIMNIVNFAHGEMMMLAMYIVFFLWSIAGIDPLIGTPIATVLLFLIGIGLYRALIRPLVGGSLVSHVFGTVGLMIFLQAAANVLWKADIRTVGDNWSTGLFQLGGILFNKPEVIAAGGALATALVLFWIIHKTDLGLAMQATAEDAQVARLLGINSDRMYAIAWGLGAALVAIGGGLLATYYSIQPIVGAKWALPAFVAVAVGGFGSVAGAFWGGLIIGLVQTVGGFLTSPSYKTLFVYGLFLAIVFFRPYGLMGRR